MPRSLNLFRYKFISMILVILITTLSFAQENMPARSQTAVSQTSIPSRAYTRTLQAGSGAIPNTLFLTGDASAVPLQSVGYYPFNDFPLGSNAKLNGNISIRYEHASLCSRYFLPPYLNPFHCNKDLSFGANLVLHATAELKAEASSQFEQRFNLLTGTLPSLTTALGTSVLVITPQFCLKLKVSGKAEAGLVTSFVAEIPVGLSLTFDGGQVTVGQGDASSTYHLSPPHLTGNTSAQLTVSAELTITALAMVNGIPIPVTPGIGVTAGVTTRVNPDATPWWDLSRDFSVDGFLFPALVGCTTKPLTGFNIVRSNRERLLASGNLNLPLRRFSNQQVRWSHDYTFGEIEEVQAIVPSLTTPGNYVLAIGDGVFDGFLMEVNPFGEPVWARHIKFGVTKWGIPTDMERTDHGTYIVCGRKASTGPAWIAEFDAGGDVLWSKTFSNLEGAGIRFTDVVLIENPSSGDPGYIVAGNVGVGDEWYNMMLRLGLDGDIVWAKRYGKNFGMGDGPYDLIRTSDGGVALAGTYRTRLNVGGVTITPADALAVKLNPVLDGSVAWASQVGDSTSFELGDVTQRGQSLTESADGTIWLGVTSQNNAYTPYASSAIITRLSGEDGSGGKSTFLKSAEHTSSFDYPRAIRPVSGGFLVVGSSGLGESKDAWAARLNLGGQVVWYKSFQGTREDDFHTLLVTPDGGALVGGYTKTFQPGILDAGAKDAFLAKIASDGMLHLDPSFDLTMNVNNDRSESSMGTLEVNRIALAPVSVALKVNPDVIGFQPPSVTPIVTVLAR